MGPFNETIPKLNSITDSFGVENIVLFLSPFAEINGKLIADPSFFLCCDKESKTKLVSLCIRCEDEAEKSFGSVYDSMREKLPKDTDLFEKLNSESRLDNNLGKIGMITENLVKSKIIITPDTSAAPLHA